MIRRISIAVLVAAGVALPFAGLLAGEAGTSGFVFLRLGNGARAGAMGEAFTAVADDATSIYFNPAGMASADGVDLNVTHSEWLMDTRFEQVSVVNEMLGGAVGFNFTGVYYGDMDRYPDYPALAPDGTFSPYDLSCAAGLRDGCPAESVRGSHGEAHLREDRFRIGDRLGRGPRDYSPEHDRRASRWRRRC